MEETPEVKFLREFNEISSNDGDSNFFRSGYVSNFPLKCSEVESQVLDWALIYLEQRKCPYNLAMSLSKTVSQDLGKSMDLHEGSNGNITGSNLEKLRSATIQQIHKLCENNPPEALLSPEQDVRLVKSASAIKNRRARMEDRHMVIDNLNSFLKLPEDAPPHSYYAVFDGHAGVESVFYVSAHLHNNIASHPEFLSDIEKAIKEGFEVTDQQLLERLKSTNPTLKSGCTAVCAIVREKDLYVAWLGDSQALLVKQASPISITTPHKPERPDEKKRIQEAGALVYFWGIWRVNGILAVSRAFGDLDYKPAVCADPDIVRVEFDGTEDLLILACDGLWDRMTMQDVMATLKTHLVANAGSPEATADQLVRAAQSRGSTDNITIVVVFLRDPADVVNSLKGSELTHLHNGSSNGTHQGPLFSKDTPDAFSNLPTPPIDDLIAPDFESQTISESPLDGENKIPEAQKQQFFEDLLKEEEPSEMSPDSEEGRKLEEDQKPEHSSLEKEMATYPPEMVTKLATDIVTETIELAVSHANHQKESESVLDLEGRETIVPEADMEEPEEASEEEPNYHNFAETEYPTMTPRLVDIPTDETPALFTNPFLPPDETLPVHAPLLEESQEIPEETLESGPQEIMPAVEENISGLSEMEIKENEINARISCEATLVGEENEVKSLNEANLPEEDTVTPIVKQGESALLIPSNEPKEMAEASGNPFSNDDSQLPQVSGKEIIFENLSTQEKINQQASPSTISEEVAKDENISEEHIEETTSFMPEPMISEAHKIDPLLKNPFALKEELEQVDLNEDPSKEVSLNWEEVPASVESETKESLEVAVGSSLEGNVACLTETSGEVMREEELPPPQTLLPLDIPEAGVQALSQSTSYTPIDESTSAESMPSEVIDFSEKTSENEVQKSPDPDATPLASPPIEPKPKEELHSPLIPSPNNVTPSLEDLGEEMRPKDLELVNLNSMEPEQPIAPVVIPEGMPEAEGVTEDSDSEKDGGWSYVKGDNVEPKSHEEIQKQETQPPPQEDEKSAPAAKASPAPKTTAKVEDSLKSKAAPASKLLVEKTAKSKPGTIKPTAAARAPLRQGTTQAAAAGAKKPTGTWQQAAAARPPMTRMAPASTASRVGLTKPLPAATASRPTTATTKPLLHPTSSRLTTTKPPVTKTTESKPSAPTTKTAATLNRTATTKALTPTTRPTPPSRTTAQKPPLSKTATTKQPTPTTRPATRTAAPKPPTPTTRSTAPKPSTTSAATKPRVSTTTTTTTRVPKTSVPAANPPKTTIPPAKPTTKPSGTLARMAASEPKLKPTTRPPAPKPSSTTSRPGSKTMVPPATKRPTTTQAGKSEPKAVPKKPASQMAVKQPAEESVPAQADIPPMEGDTSAAQDALQPNTTTTAGEGSSDGASPPKVEDSTSVEEGVTHDLLEI